MGPRFRNTVAMALLLACFAGCSKQKLIPNTKIPKTKLNLDLLGVVEKYRRAMERKKPAEILVLVHPSYRDNSGTPEAKDDIDFAGVKELLKTRFKLVSRIRYRIEFQHVAVKGREAKIDTWIDATFVYKHPEHLPRYRRHTDYHRYRLLKEGNRWLFISGL